MSHRSPVLKCEHSLTTSYVLGNLKSVVRSYHENGLQWWQGPT
jgi:hypothetical protein